MDATRAGVGCTGRGWRSKAGSRAGSGREATGFFKAGFSLPSFGGPGINDAAVVEAVSDKAGGVAQDQAAFFDGDGAAKQGRVGGELRAAEPLIGRGRALVASGSDGGIADRRVDGLRLGQRLVERDAAAERLDGLVAGVGKGGCRREADAGAAIAEGQIGGVVELERRGQVQARAGRDDPLVGDVILGESWLYIDGVVLDGRDGDDFAGCRSADNDFVANCDAVRAADLDLRGAGTDGSGEVGLNGRGADMCDGDGFNAVAEGVDVETDFVADGDVFKRSDFDVGGAGDGVVREIGLRAGLADGGDGGDFVLLDVSCDRRIGCAVAEGDLLSDFEIGNAFDRHVGGAGGNGDDEAFRQRLPDGGVIGGRRAVAGDGAGFSGCTVADGDGVVDLHAGCIAEVNGGVSGVRGNGEAGVGKAEQIEAVGGEFGSGRHFD